MARPSDTNEQLLCSFCGKSQRQVKKLIAGPGVYICDECIDLCNEIIDEELIAAAHASCFAMALSHGLTEAGHAPEHLSVKSKVTLDERDGAPTVTTSELTVTGRVPGIDQAEFERAAADAGKNCPVSRALAGLEISVKATLQ